MPEAGWLLLLLFLGCCSLIVVAILGRSYRWQAQPVRTDGQRQKEGPLLQRDTTPPFSQETAWIDMLCAALHLLIIGHSRSGKTSLIHECALRWVAGKHRVIVCDLDAAPGLWSGCEVYGYGNDSQAINNALEQVRDEVEHRRTMRGTGTQRSFSPLYIVIDEYRDVVRSCTSARELVEDILRRGGKLDVHLVLGVQDRQVKTMGFEGQGELRRNFSGSPGIAGVGPRCSGLPKWVGDGIMRLTGTVAMRSCSHARPTHR